MKKIILRLSKCSFLEDIGKISDISYCKMKRGGLNVYVNGKNRKAFFIDGMTDHFDNFVKRMERRKKYYYSRVKRKN